MIRFRRTYIHSVVTIPKLKPEQAQTQFTQLSEPYLGTREH